VQYNRFLQILLEIIGRNEVSAKIFSQRTLFLTVISRRNYGKHIFENKLLEKKVGRKTCNKIGSPMFP
jgi:hypothetical protein